jgi:hypothetical protein
MLGGYECIPNKRRAGRPEKKGRRGLLAIARKRAEQGG